MLKQGVSVFVPTYNSKAILEKNILEIYNYFKKIQDEFEIVIVDDNSKDDSINILKRLSEEYKNIRFIASTIGPSRRENLAQAFREARFDYVIFMDLDLATRIENLNRLLEYISNGYDIVTGSRYLGIKPTRQLYRQVISTIYNLIMRVYHNSKIYDHQCGFKGGKQDVFIKLIDEMGYDNSFNRGWFWDAEFLIRAQKKGLKIKEFPVNWHYAEKSSFSFFREIRMIPSIIMLKFKIKK